MKKSTTLATCGIVAGVLTLTGIGGAAFADTPIDNDDVTVNVAIEETDVDGALAMSVASNVTTLTENGSTDLQRTFTGTLPTVTVTDTRDPATIPADAFWAVTGSVGNFVGTAGQPDISGTNLGWTPALLGDSGESGLVVEGDPVLPSAEGGDGLFNADALLAIDLDSTTTRPEGQWTANAALKLATAADVAPGTYAATLTLTLIE